MEKPTLVLVDGTVIDTPDYVCKDSLNSSAYVSYRWISCDGVQVIQDREYGCKNLSMGELKSRKADLEDAMQIIRTEKDAVTKRKQHLIELLLIRYDQCLTHMALRLIGVQQEGTPSENLKHIFTG